MSLETEMAMSDYIDYDIVMNHVGLSIFAKRPPDYSVSHTVYRRKGMAQINQVWQFVRGINTVAQEWEIIDFANNMTIEFDSTTSILGLRVTNLYRSRLTSLTNLKIDTDFINVKLLRERDLPSLDLDTTTVLH